MPQLRKSKHERFAQLLAVGDKTQGQAYEEAGYRPDDSHASRLARNGLIRTRVAEIQAEGAKHAALTRGALLARMYELSLKAEEDGKYSSAIRATERVGQEAQGMFKDRSVVEQAGSLQDVPDQELLERLCENLNVLGVPGARALLGVDQETADSSDEGEGDADQPARRKRSRPARVTASARSS